MKTSRTITGINADRFAAAEGIGGNFELRASGEVRLSSMIVADLRESRSTPRRSFGTQTIPDWCHTAYIFERDHYRPKQTDWGFVAPVWIAVALFCTIVQVAAFKTLFAAFG